MKDGNLANSGEENNWFLVIKTASPGLRATWVAGQTAAETIQPWIHVASHQVNINSGLSVFPSTHEDAIVSIENFGPGPLQITPGDLGAGYQVLSALTVEPAQTGNVTVRFTAALPAGDKDHVAALATNDPDTVAYTDPASQHNATVELHARVGIVDTVLVLDASGSMSWAADGTPNPPGGERRWDFLTEAVQQLTAGYLSFLSTSGIGSSAGRLSIALFPDVTEVAPNWYQNARVILTADVDATIESQVAAALAAPLTPKMGTPMGEGIGAGMGETEALGAFDPGPGNTRWLVVMSDGAHNAGAISPSAFYLSPLDGVPDFVDKEVRVLTVAYGDEGSSNVDHATLENLAENGFGFDPEVDPETGNHAFSVEPGPDGMKVRTAFQNVLAKTVDLQYLSDPEGVLYGQSTAEHVFEINTLQANFGLFVDWGRRNARLGVELISPRCETFGEEEIRAHEHMRLSRGNLFLHVFVDAAVLNGEYDENTRYGPWKLRVFQDSEGIYKALPYMYSILGKSALQLRVSAGTSVGTGEPLEIAARLHHGGVPVEHAHVRVELDVPTTNVHGRLVHTSVSEDLYQSLLEDSIVKQELGRSWALKAQALRQMQISTEVARGRVDVVLHEVSAGSYQAAFADTTMPGIYRGRVIATGTLPDDTSYRREEEFQVRVEARPDRSATEIGWGVEENGSIVNVLVEPLDKYGTPVLIDPSAAPRLTVTASNGQPGGPMVNQLDGRYRQTFHVDPKQRTTISIAWDGETIHHAPAPIPAGLLWMETVGEFTPGSRAKHSRYQDPEQAVGPVAGSDHPFVALAGNGGALTLQTKSRRFRASSITVFVHPSAHGRPYRVEVTLLRKQGVFAVREWVVLGDSRGATKSFEVPRRLHGYLTAVRVSDLSSGKTSEDLPDAPGVLVQGVGYELIRRAAPPRHGITRVPAVEGKVTRTVSTKKPTPARAAPTKKPPAE